MTLAAHHYTMLHTASAITDAVITARGYTSLDHPDEVRDLGFTKAQARTAPVLAIPLWDVHGQQTGWQIRPDSPRQMKDGKVFKYETAKGGRLMLDVHPSVQALLGDPHVPLWITEGVRKGDALVSHGACALGLMGGIWGYRGTNAHGGKVILPDWEHVALNGRLVYVAYDSDLACKPQAEAAVKGLWTFLRERQALPARVQWPEAYQEKKWGVDDFLADHNTLEDLQAFIPPIGPLPTTAPQHGPAPAAPTVALLLTKDQRPRGALANVLTVLADDPRWQSVLGYNALSDEVTFLTRPPCYPDATPWTPRALEDHDDAEIAAWMQRYHQVFTSTTVVHEAVQAAAHRAPYHPIRDYLRALTWDAQPRLDRWLTTYCGAQETPYTRQVGATTLIGAVARVERPGSKVDTASVLIGPQGIGKSTTWRVLCGDAWFSDTLPDLHDKDAMQALRGTWILELGELATLHRSEIEVIKRYLSATQDHYRPSYGRRARTFLRQNIFVGTTNKEDIFKDETGNRRFYPITITGPCDTEALARDRDQLWAEAVHRYRAGEAWHLDATMTALAEQVQAEHMELDPWTEKVLTSVQPKVGTEKVTTAEIMQGAFLWDNPALWTPAASKRIGAILRLDGWRPAKKERPKEGEPPDASGTRHRAAAFWKDAPISSGTDGTGQLPTPLASVPAVFPYEHKLNTDGTDGTALFTHVRTSPTGAPSHTEVQEHTSPVFPNIQEPPVPSVTSVPDRINTSANGIWPSCDICARAHHPADICAKAHPAIPLAYSTPSGQRLPCRVCGGSERWQDGATWRCVTCWPKH